MYHQRHRVRSAKRARSAPRWLPWALLSLAALLCVVPIARAQSLTPIQVAPDVFFVQGAAALGSSANRNFISNAGFVITADSVLVVDALGSPALAKELLEEIARITPKPVSHVFVTHYHADHIYGLQTFQQAGAKIVAHPAAREYLQSDAALRRLQSSRVDMAPWVDENTRLVPADIWVDAATDLTLGGVRIRLIPAGPAHTPEDLVVSVVDRKVVFSGDLVFLGRIPFVGQADSRSWIASIDLLAALKPDVIVPGHGPHTQNAAEAVQFTRGYLGYLRQAMGTAAREMEPFEDAYRRTDWSAYSKLPLFGLANRMNAYNTFLQMEQER